MYLRNESIEKFVDPNSIDKVTLGSRLASLAIE